MTDYAFWHAQLAGANPETRLPHQPEAGFYRRKRNDREYTEALKAGTAKGTAWSGVAIWKEDGEWCCVCQHGYEPRHLDEICGLFANICRNAVTEEAYHAAMHGEPWPDEVSERGPDERQVALYAETEAEKAMRVAPAREGPAEIGDNSGEVAPFEIMRERIADVGAQVRDWLAGIGGEIKTQAQADKAANFADLFAEIEKEAVATHKREKEPWLEGGRKVDGAWKPVIELADGSKRRAKGLLTPFLQEQARIAAEAARKAREEQEAAARAAREEAERAAAEGREAEPPAPLPVATPAVAPPKAGTRGRVTSLRTVKRVQIDDLAALAAFIAGLSPSTPEFIEACSRIADRMLRAGVNVPGAHLSESTVAA